jgi:large subunit ribosomal protein L11e
VNHARVAGYNISEKKRKRGRVGAPHRITKEETMKWFQQKYDGMIMG